MRDMTKCEVKLFIQIKNASESEVTAMFKALCDEDGGWVLKAIEKRFQAYKIPADKQTMIMVLYIGDGIVGKCAKYVDDIVVKSAKLDLDKIDFDDFTNKIYPMGFP